MSLRLGEVFKLGLGKDVHFGEMRLSLRLDEVITKVG